MKNKDLKTFKENCTEKSYKEFRQEQIKTGSLNTEVENNKPGELIKGDVETVVAEGKRENRERETN